ncbi:P-loop containing nucleoside triphosphate hydrolase protein [Violaceomyces palustris]|uniref:P-loop containing nucleoside triphosphate hydrolase protein n=1 Tax=Violaceomyces palustris TaxID=1673888 RepID=A0ACD0NVQ4_9BASI|nr:P-loop containing nucleoside triphosphate hydrolase protein [Violaceomyces palustris]
MMGREQVDTDQNVECPSCQTILPYSNLNQHLDRCLTETSFGSEGGFASGHPSKSAPSTSRERLDAARPFAERMRPQSLEEFVGQDGIIHGPLKALLSQGRIPSMILWGPPGTGKTTLARILAKSVPSRASFKPGAPITPPHRFVELSATSAGTVEVKKVMDEALNRLQLTGQRTVLFIDEIQRFSRAQQDVFLPSVEKGQIILIAATTENPSFRLQGALLSRMRVFVLTKLSVDECHQVLKNALARESASTSAEDEIAYPHLDEEMLRWIATMADGDARTALSALELAITTVEAGASCEENLSRLKTALKRTWLQYDRTGDHHYDTISALHKSIRGSNPDAALYWLARMVCSGDDPLFIARRLIVAASEDCNTLEALQMATATYTACQVVGLPECGENLAQCVVFLAESPKSTRAYRGWKKAQSMVKGAYNYPVPLHIRNAPTKLMKDLSYGKEYRYEPSFAHPVHQEFFPPELKGTRFLSPPLEGEDDEDRSEEQAGCDSQGQGPRLSPRGGGGGGGGGENLHMKKEAGIGPGSCQRLFKLGARAVDLDLLEEWEREQNKGNPWVGRKSLMALIARSGRSREEDEGREDA